MESVVKDPFQHLPEVPDLRGQITIDGVRPVYSGPYSCVYRGKYEKDGKTIIVAVKILNKMRGTELEKMLRKLTRERRTWGALDHPNILPLYGFVDDEEVYQPGALVSPWLEKGDAESFLAVHGKSMELEKRILLWKDVVSGMNYLHSFNPVLIHGDLKPRNVLIDDLGNAKICDFGLARIFLEEGSSGMTTTSVHTGTERYLARELVVGGDEACPTTASDVHAMGCIGLEFIFSQIPYSNRKNNLRGGIYSDIKRGMLPGQRPDDLSPTSEFYWTLLVECWNLDPSKRPDAPQLFRNLMTWLERSKYGDTSIPQTNRRAKDAHLAHSELRLSQSSQYQTSADPKAPIQSYDKGYTIYNALSPSLGSSRTNSETEPPSRTSLQRSSGSLTNTTNVSRLLTPNWKPDGSSVSEMQALVPLHQSRTHKIRITVVAAEDLIKRTILSYPDPFAVTTVDGSQTQTTSAVKKTLNPHWNESFEFTVTDSSLVNVQVFDQRQFNTKDQGFLGSINVKISNVLDLERDVERQTKLNLQKSIENITVRGRIIIVLSANSSTRLNNSGSSQTQISGMSKRTDNSDLSASNTDRSIKSGLTAIKRTILKMSKPTPTTLTLDRRSTILLQAARRPSELEEKTISAYEDPGMDALRGGFGSVGSIIRARSMRNSIASRTGPASPAVEQWRQRHPYASEGDEPTNSNIFMPGVQRHQLYDAPVPRGSATSINTGGSRDDSISSRGKPRRVHKSIKFGNEDTRHFYPSLGLPGGVRHHSVKDNPHQQDAAYPPTSTGGDSVLSPQHMMSPEALRKQSKASNSFGDPALRVDTAGSTDNEVEEVPLTPSRSLHKLHPYSSDSAEDSEG